MNRANKQKQKAKTTLRIRKGLEFIRMEISYRSRDIDLDNPLTPLIKGMYRKTTHEAEDLYSKLVEDLF